MLGPPATQVRQDDPHIAVPSLVPLPPAVSRRKQILPIWVRQPGQERELLQPQPTMEVSGKGRAPAIVPQSCICLLVLQSFNSDVSRDVPEPWGGGVTGASISRVEATVHTCFHCSSLASCGCGAASVPGPRASRVPRRQPEALGSPCLCLPRTGDSVLGTQDWIANDSPRDAPALLL